MASSTNTSNNVGFRSERGPILIALMLTTGLVAIDSTILATAIPSIVKDFGGFAQFPWLFSIFLLGQAVSVPIFAKLSDVIGRKPVLLLGIGLFIVGSIFSGFAWSMGSLIAFRALQGLGAGAILPTASTVAGDIYTVAERAKVQGYLASVWAISAVIGPSLGGIFSQFLTWRWIFYVNVPLCIVAVWMLLRAFHETVERRKHRIDYAGVILLTASLSLLILAVLEGGQGWAWNSPQSIGAFVIGGILLVAFVLVERRAAEPVLPLWVLSRRLLLTTTLASLGVGAILIGLTSYVPTYLEGSLGAAPTIAGLTLAVLTIGWPLASSLSGRFYLRIGFRNTMLIGIVFVLLGATVLVTFAFAPSVVEVAIGCMVIGLGLGFVATPSIVAAQASVGWSERGVVTGANMFARSIGSAVGVAIFGAVANSIFAAHGGDETDVATIMSAASAVFIAVLIAALLTLIAVFAMPRQVTFAEPDAVDA